MTFNLVIMFQALDVLDIFLRLSDFSKQSYALFEGEKSVFLCKVRNCMMKR